MTTNEVLTLIAIVLVFIPSFLQARNSSASALPQIIERLREEIAVLTKEKIQAEDNADFQRNRYKVASNEKAAYIIHAERLERLLRRHAPHVKIPDVEINGNTPEFEKEEK